MPHIKVAKDRINAGEKPEALVNHAISYIITESATDGSVADRAFDEKKFLASLGTKLVVIKTLRIP